MDNNADTRRLTPAEINQRLAQNKTDRLRKQFLDTMEDPFGPRDWQIDDATRKWYLDDGKMYDGEEQARKFMLAEIQPGQHQTVGVFPVMPWALFVKGERIGSDESLPRLKAMAEDILDG